MASSDLISLIKEEHGQILSLFDEFKRPGIDNEVKQKIAWSVIRLLSMHSSKEEEVVYPVVREKEGEKAADHLLEEHQTLKNLLSELDSMKVTDSGFESKFVAIRAELEQHVREEETDFLVKLRSLPGVDMHDLGRKFLAAEAHSVTRPHPMAPNKPPMNIAANMATSPLDAAADQLRFAGHPPQLHHTTA